ncbi:MAG: glycine betaine ABC transporter substrate-binding protein [Candidatus Acidiferrales bacterium]
MLRRLILILLPLLLSGCAREQPGRVVVGSKNFTEQLILGELVAQHIEARTGLEVERRFNLGGTFICHQALVAGQIDVYVEYTGTALTAILKQPPERNPDQVFRTVQEQYRPLGLEWTLPLGFNNTFAMVIRGEDARRHNLTTISDIARVAPRWRAGFGYEFTERADGLKGLVETYGLKFGSPPRAMELGLLYRALTEKQVDIVAGNSTDGLIEALDLVALEDDRHYFPPYFAAPVARRATLERLPELRRALAELAGKISEEEMRRLNYAVEGESRDLRGVVREFLRSKGL